MKKIAGSGIWESFAESACKLFICWVAIRKPKTSRRKRKPKPRITGIKGCKPAEPHAVQAEERNSSSKLWRHQVDYRAQKTKKQCWTSTFLKWKATRPLRARELHSVKPMTKCKVHLALRAPMPWKAWSFQQIHQLIHFIDSQAALVFRSLMMSHGFLVEFQPCCLERVVDPPRVQLVVWRCVQTFDCRCAVIHMTFKWHRNCQGFYHSKARTFFVAPRAKLTCT